MKFSVVIFLLLFAVYSCKEDAVQSSINNETENTELIKLRNQVEQLTLESYKKDSVLNETIQFFNEVQANLAMISVKEDEIRIKSTTPELSSDDREWILQEIQNINFLRKENARNIDLLKKQLSDKTLDINELNNMVDRLVKQIQAKDEKISALQNSLTDLNMEYAALFDEYQEQVSMTIDVMKEMNTVYFAYGTIDELVENGVLVREGGFIGIGKQTNIAEDINESYFQKLDKTKVKEFTIIGKKPQLATDHPVSSYKWEDNRLIILEPNRFWRVSNFLVVIVK